MTTTDIAKLAEHVNTNQFDLTKTEATKLLDFAKDHAETFKTVGQALKALHDRKGYKALGYSTFAKMIEAEFSDMSVRTAYRRLSIGSETHKAAAVKAQATKAAKKSVPPPAHAVIEGKVITDVAPEVTDDWTEDEKAEITEQVKAWPDYSNEVAPLVSGDPVPALVVKLKEIEAEVATFTEAEAELLRPAVHSLLAAVKARMAQD